MTTKYVCASYLFWITVCILLGSTCEAHSVTLESPQDKNISKMI